MLILHITFCLRAPWCRNLKDKRSEMQRLIRGLRNKFNVSVAESGRQDTHTLLEISLAALAFDRAQGDSMAENFYGFVEGNTEAEIIQWEADYL